MIKLKDGGVTFVSIHVQGTSVVPTEILVDDLHVCMVVFYGSPKSAILSKFWKIIQLQELLLMLEVTANLWLVLLWSYGSTSIHILEKSSDFKSL